MSVASMVHTGAAIEPNDIAYTDDDEEEDDELREDQEEEEEEEELPECKVKRNYSCNSCDFFTQNPRHHLYHLRDVHGEKVKIYECSNCLYASRHFQKLCRHKRMVHDAPVPVSSAELTHDDVPMEEEPQDLLFKCSVCDFPATSRIALNRHEREEHIKTKFFRCTKCTYATHMKARFTKHVKYHSMPMIKCDMCDFRTPYKWNLDRHCKNHNGRGAFRCSACNFTADIKQSLTVHEMNHHVPPVGQAAGLGVGRRRNKVGASDATAAEEAARQHQDPIESSAVDSTNKSFGPDFINPDDIIQHANGNVYIKNKCTLCNYKSAWPSEMTKHEKRVHNIGHNQDVVSSPPPAIKSKKRPIPNLIPITPKLTTSAAVASEEPAMSQQDMKDICAKSANSALKDFASLFGSEDVFDNSLATNKQQPNDEFKMKNASFFDKLKEKLQLTNNGSGLVCKRCGHESKCLTAHAQHTKTCGLLQNAKTQRSPFISASRCQYCRQRCKSSTDLYNHLQTCAVALKMKTEEITDDTEGSENELKIDESQLSDDTENNNNNNEDYTNKPHPMENRVFVWNNIEVPMDIEVDDSKYEYTGDDKMDDNISLDLSVRTQSPAGSEHSFAGQELAAHTAPIVQSNSHQTQPHSTVATSDKIPTHGNDISVAQHKRVFKCPHCTFWASTASRFHVHIVGHLNKKPFECSLCAYRSNWRWDITKHIKLKSVRDPQHESAKVLMTDETGRRNYTKYNKYLTEIHVSGNSETSGGSGTRPRHSSPNQGKNDLPKLTRAPDFSPLLQRSSPLRPPPPLKAADGSYFKLDKAKKGNNNVDNNKRTLFKCKKCNFRDASRDVLLEHVKGHYPQTSATTTSSSTAATAPNSVQMRNSNGNNETAIVPESVLGYNSSSSDKDERHCRLKHSGDIRVVSSKNGLEKVEIEEQTDEPDHVDVLQSGAFKCLHCPFSSDIATDLDQHQHNHTASSDSIMKCHYCAYFVEKKEDLYDHLTLHGVHDPEDFLAKLYGSGDSEVSGKRFKCLVCPYVTNSKSQYTYHKQFHKPRGGQYTCTQCSYNVSKRHLLHQHLKVHGINVTPQKQNGDVIDLDDISDEIEEVPASGNALEMQNLPDIPLVWVSKSGKFSKMFKCRYCPHVNLRKVNIQEHEKMHGVREKNPNSSRTSEIEHRCMDCNYICNNAGVLSSHSKVHQGVYGLVHCLVDPVKSDEEQIRELSKAASTHTETMDDFGVEEEIEEDQNPGSLYFCKECPARFLKETEYNIHIGLHGVRLFYKCHHCSYSARQKPHLLAHSLVHTTAYQERTKVLQTIHTQSNTQPELYPGKDEDGETVWLVVSLEMDIENMINKPHHSKVNVPLSGTELFQQKSEAQLKLKEPSPPSPKPQSDPQFGTMMHGNPKFIYPTYLKNGRMKEKRYKCPKCPSAFEKREQYKVHLNLHGSKQRYNCEHCDYSVKYYANYVQHLKKHKMNSEAIAAREDTEMETEDVVEVPDDGKKLSVGDQQSLNILQQQLTMNNRDAEDSKPKVYSCTVCPYVNHRKDAVDNHQKRHVSISGTTNNYTCKHCDYSVPQKHFLKEHTRWHFTPNTQANQVDGFMMCDKYKLVARKPSEDGNDDEVIFEETSQEFLPRLSEEVTTRFNNNDGEQKLITIDNAAVATDSSH